MAAKKKVPAKKTTKKSVVKPTKKAVKKTAKPAKKASTPKKKKKGDTLMCFLTTACVHHYQLADNGYELTTLRQFRDSYMLSSGEGKDLIKEYYRVSPKIVERIEKDRDKSSVYEYIHKQVIRACDQIEQDLLSAAKKTYVGMVRRLMKRYELTGI
jgi:hypothetical protein